MRNYLIRLLFSETERYLIAEALRTTSDNKLRSIGETLKDDGLILNDLWHEFKTKNDINK